MGYRLFNQFNCLRNIRIIVTVYIPLPSRVYRLIGGTYINERGGRGYRMGGGKQKRIVSNPG